jgi:thiamine biosynthesis lipoprotein
LEKLGYDQHYNFAHAPTDLPAWQLPHWNVHHRDLIIDGPVVFDIGGIGKGYWIDHISQLLLKADLPYHLVDGGGDMMGTTKRNGEGWRIALEWPGRPEMAIGLSELKNQAIAVSDTFKRRWKNWHHLISAQSQKPLQEIVGLMAIAPTAFAADQCTSGLAFGSPKKIF